MKHPISLLIIATFSHVLFNTFTLLILKSLSVNLEAPVHLFLLSPLDHGSCFPFLCVQSVLILHQTDAESQGLHSEPPQKPLSLVLAGRWAGSSEPGGLGSRFVTVALFCP